MTHFGSRSCGRPRAGGKGAGDVQSQRRDPPHTPGGNPVDLVSARPRDQRSAAGRTEPGPAGHARTHTISWLFPGFEMLERCNNKRDSKCVPCREGFFNEAMNYYKCKPCSWCYTDTGSQKSENCTATKDTVCHCSEGTQPRMNGRGPSGTECVPCPPAYYSPGENRICRPWTNCTAEGKQTLRAGTSKADAICEGQRPSRAPLPLISRHSQTTATQVRGLLSTGPQPTSQHPLESTQELLPLVLVGLTVLVVSGLITLLLTIYVSRRREERPPPEFGRQEVKSFRVPVQEQTDAHSSLVKN
ncbi:tumor necrosis factor receptor superfamily member 4 isoform X1 [Ornithorhynchus anatinus]|uniref:tumor necrosis factor receptor superfamily member 4 isoform X1 n=1 Tax=Ornithorhynchus anatinus TaxID=9258 RepID=UPI0010A88898|nr:tumor necrosis factor receptor superfamily member 4 isoform X1 [Ornithorhynchus anatinus]